MGKTLALIDFQKIFADPNFGWCVPNIESTVTRAQALEKKFLAEGHTVIWTRFEPPYFDIQKYSGPWKSYYQKFPFAIDLSNRVLYDLIAPPSEESHVVTSPKFEKWDTIKNLVKGDLYIAGVTADCCVLSTILPAIDDGIKVNVVLDLVLGSSSEFHSKVYDILREYAPMVEMVWSSQL